jgi:hypothetical protein
MGSACCPKFCACQKHPLSTCFLTWFFNITHLCYSHVQVIPLVLRCLSWPHKAVTSMAQHMLRRWTWQLSGHLHVMGCPTYMEDHLGALEEEVQAGMVPLPQLPKHKQVSAGCRFRGGLSAFGARGAFSLVFVYACVRALACAPSMHAWCARGRACAVHARVCSVCAALVFSTRMRVRA